jgi:hypothetical protein
VNCEWFKAHQKCGLGWVSPLGAPKAPLSQSCLLNIILGFRVKDLDIASAL